MQAILSNKCHLARAAMLFVLPIMSIAFAAQAQQTSPCTISAPAVYQLVLLLAQTTPIRTDLDFRPLQRTLDLYCFKKTSNSSWVYASSSAQVFVTFRPNQRSISVSLLPGQPTHLGDAALAALINRATHITASEGDAIELELPSRPTLAKHVQGTVTETLGFRLNAGEWFSTSAFIEWPP
jgi:hypothetical protein